MMIGDDIKTDVLAAQQHGLTGGADQDRQVSSPHPPGRQRHPDHVLDSFAGLPALLEQLN